jgi:hypothetical protein
MAIDDHPDIRCQHLAHRNGQEPPAVAVVRHRDSLNGRWWAWCNPHVDYATADPDPVPYDVAYLDPARQRRPVALELDTTTGVGTVHYHTRGAVCTDDCYTVPAVTPGPMTTEATP